MLALIRGVFAQNSKVSVLALGTIVIVLIWGLIGVVTITAGCSVDAIIPRRGDDYCADSVSHTFCFLLGGPLLLHRAVI
jgi:hypothetical protein